MKMLRFSMFVIALAMLSKTSHFAWATVIFDPAAVGSSNYPGADASMTTNGSGLSNPSLVADGSPVPGSYPTNDVEGGTTFFNNFVAYTGTSPMVTYTFSSPVEISDIHFWQYSGDDPLRALTSASILVTYDGTHYVAAGALNTSAYPEPPLTTQDPGQDFPFSASGIVGIQFQNLTPVSESQANGPFVGFSEIRFVGNTVPEPGTLTLASLGVAALAWVTYKRRKNSI